MNNMIINNFFSNEDITYEDKCLIDIGDIITNKIANDTELNELRYVAHDILEKNYIETSNYNFLVRNCSSPDLNLEGNHVYQHIHLNKYAISLLLIHDNSTFTYYDYLFCKIENIGFFLCENNNIICIEKRFLCILDLIKYLIETKLKLILNINSLII